LSASATTTWPKARRPASRGSCHRPAPINSSFPTA
jgi:hypothetical protein